MRPFGPLRGPVRPNERRAEIAAEPGRPSAAGSHRRKRQAQTKQIRVRYDRGRVYVFSVRLADVVLGLGAMLALAGR